MPAGRAESRYRRRVLGVGGFAAFVLYVIGAPIFNNRIENDLETRVPEALASAGFDGIEAKFSGQEGTLTCTAVLADPEAALRAAHDVRGVQSVRLDRGCRVTVLPGDGSSDPDETGVPPASAASGSAGTAVGEPTPSVPDYDTVAAVITQDGRFSSLALLTGGSPLAAQLGDAAAGPFTVFAPTDTAFDAVPAATAARLDADADARQHVGNALVVDGAVTFEALRQMHGGTLTTLAGTPLPVAVDGAAVTVGGAQVTGPGIEVPNGLVYGLDRVLLPDALTTPATAPTVIATLAGGRLSLAGTVADEAAAVALRFAALAIGADRLDDELQIGDTGLDAATSADLASLITALQAELVSGEAGFDGTGLYLTGTFANDAGAARAEAAAAAVGAASDLAPRPTANAGDAAELEVELNEYVGADPIQFEPGSAVLADTAEAIIDRIAARLVEFGGLTVIVEGHTDSDGSESGNQTLSEQRAGVVVQELVRRGVEPAALIARGFGEAEPVIEGGLENKTASRRVEFQISAG